MELLQWLTSTNLGEMFFTMLVSMVPIIELRGGVPFGTALGLPPGQALVASIIGNMIPIPFIIVYIRRIFLWMRRKSPKLNSLVDKLEKKAHLKGQKVTKYKYIGLWIFVAIPLPGTGAWTGALAAAFLDMPLRKALPSIFLGVVTAGLIMTFATGIVVSTVGS
ncbi:MULTISPECIES: COG2426 family protein [unclassified Flavonifractor]|uniref:COG2426 family protein n=2 Tax=Flavonifractor TaxID=946234 RepID=UPI0026CF7348